MYETRKSETDRALENKSSYFQVKLKRIKFELLTEPELDHT